MSEQVVFIEHDGWRRIQRRIYEGDACHVLFSTKEHSACHDCEYVRVAGMPNRMCVARPEVHLWFQSAPHELIDFPSTVILSDTDRQCVDHPGQTMADVCPYFKLDSAFDGQPVAYWDDYYDIEATTEGAGKATT